MPGGAGDGTDAESRPLNRGPGSGRRADALQVTGRRRIPGVRRHGHEHHLLRHHGDGGREARPARLRRAARGGRGPTEHDAGVQGVPVARAEARSEHAREHVGASGAELRVGRLHRQAWHGSTQYWFHPVRGTPQRPRPERARHPDCGADGAPLTATSTTSSSTVASRAARPTPAGSATSPPASSRRRGRPRRCSGSPATSTKPSQVHRERRARRRPALLLLRVPLCARRAGAQGRDRPRCRRADHHRRQAERAEGRAGQAAAGIPARRRT